MAVSRPPNEEARLAHLRSLHVLDTLPESEFDDLVEAAAAFLGVPIALVSLVDEDRQWFKAKVGVQICETSREVAFCAHTILSSEPLIVPDATKDPRFADNPLVTGEFHLRCYVGTPIVVDGYSVGALCCIDFEPRTFTDAQIQGLVCLGHSASALLIARRKSMLLAECEARLSVFLDHSPTVVLLKDEGGRVRYANRNFKAVSGLSSETVLGLSDSEWLPAAVAEEVMQHERVVRETGSSLELEEHVPDVSGALRIWQVQKFPVQMEEGTWVGSVALDVTHLRMAEMTIRTQAEELSRQNDALRKTTGDLEEANARLQTLVTVDSLTGVRNLRAFESKLGEEVARAARSGTPLSLALVDVDYFKEFNDEFGHQAGDAELRRLARALESAARSTDLVARYGGEEFVVLMPETNADSAITCSDRLRQMLENMRWQNRPVTASFGVSTLRPGMTKTELIKEADEALYESKRIGRNTVTHRTML